jgi:hypothetical protein
MPMMPAMDPRMDPVPAHATTPSGELQTVHEEPDGELRLSSPGFMGKDWGGITPAGIVVAHVVYGLALAFVYYFWGVSVSGPACRVRWRERFRRTDATS